MRQAASQYLYIFFASLFLIHLFNYFIQSSIVNYVLGVFTIVMFIISYFDASKLFKILSISFIIIGISFYISSGQTIIVIPGLLTSNLSLLTLFTMLPWINSVVKSGRFDRTINKIMKIRVNRLDQLYRRSSFSTFTLAAFLNLPAITIAQDVLKTNLSTVNDKLRNNFISVSTLRGYSLALAWSPLEITVAVSIFLTQVSYTSILPWLLSIVVIMFVLDFSWSIIKFGKFEIDLTKPYKDINIRRLVVKLIHLLVALLIFLAIVSLSGNLINIDFIITITLIIFPFSFIWALLMKRIKSFLIIGWKTWKKNISTMQSFIVLFVSLSLFTTGINETNLPSVIEQSLMIFSNSPIVILFLIQFVILIMSLLGVHSIATIGLISGLIGSITQFISPESLAIVFISSSVATFPVSTYGLIVTLTSTSLKLNPYRISINNMLFALLFGTVGTLIAYFLVK